MEVLQRRIERCRKRKYVVLATVFFELLIAGGTISTIGLFIVEWQQYYGIGATAAGSIAMGISVVGTVMGQSVCLFPLKNLKALFNNFSL